MNPPPQDPPPLTDEELISLRLMLEKERRIVWFWATLRVWTGWVAAVATAYFAVKALLADVVVRLAK